MATTGYKEPTQAMTAKFGRIHEKLVKFVESLNPEDYYASEPGVDTHFRNTDLGSRIEFTDGKMTYFIVLDAARNQE